MIRHHHPPPNCVPPTSLRNFTSRCDAWFILANIIFEKGWPGTPRACDCACELSLHDVRGCLFTLWPSMPCLLLALGMQVFPYALRAYGTASCVDG